MATADREAIVSVLSFPNLFIFFLYSWFNLNCVRRAFISLPTSKTPGREERLQEGDRRQEAGGRRQEAGGKAAALNSPFTCPCSCLLPLPPAPATCPCPCHLPLPPAPAPATCPC